MRRVLAGEKGFALITALWAAMVLALVTGSVIAMANTEHRTTHGEAERVELDAADDGAIAMVELALLAPYAAAHLPTDGTPFDVACCGRTVRVTLQDEAGLVDLNMADDVLLRRLMEVAGGLDPDSARVMADRIMDWREPGSGKRLNGAKAEDYRAAGYAHGPRGAPFATVEELRLLMGMTPELFARLEPVLTIASQNPFIDSQVAPQAVLLLLPGAQADQVDAFLYDRIARHAREAKLREGQVGSLVGHSMHISALAIRTTGATSHRQSELRITGLTRAPVWVYGDF